MSHAETPLSADRPLRRRRDLVADAPDGDDRRRLSQLATKLPDVDVDRASVAGECVAPDALEQLVAREHEPTVVEQLPEEVELLGRELHFLFSDLDLAPPRVDEEVSVLDLSALGRS